MSTVLKGKRMESKINLHVLARFGVNTHERFRLRWFQLLHKSSDR
jgi:hypothetical protein